MLTFTGELVKPTELPLVAKEYYRGALRLILVLHHDFPEFLADSNFRFCTSIPTHCTQLRNLILSACPSNFPELPDPFTSGLKVDRLEEIRKAPTIRGDIDAPLQRAEIEGTIDSCLRSKNNGEALIQKICEAIYHPSRLETGFDFAPVTVDTVFLQSLILHIGMDAIKAAQPKEHTFNEDLVHVKLFERLAHKLRPEARYHLISAIVNQLRFPNSHTHYFSYLLLHLFNQNIEDETDTECQVAQQITRVLLERLNLHRPHPWGLIVTLLEILKNPNYKFWELPFVEAVPQVSISQALLAALEARHLQPRPYPRY